MAVLVLGGSVEIRQPFFLSLALGLVDSAQKPLQQSIAADLMPREALANAVALNAVAFNTARFIGPPIAGLVIASVGLSATFVLNALSCLGVFGGLAAMDTASIRRQSRAERAPSIVAGLREALASARGTPIVLWPLALFGGVSMFGVNFNILFPLCAVDVLHVDAVGYGSLYGAFGHARGRSVRGGRTAPGAGFRRWSALRRPSASSSSSSAPPTSSCSRPCSRLRPGSS